MRLGSRGRAIVGRKSFDRLINEALKKDKNDLTVLVAKLRKLDEEKSRKKRLSEVVEAADAVLAQLDEDAIAQALIGQSAADDTRPKSGGLDDFRFSVATQI